MKINKTINNIIIPFILISLVPGCVTGQKRSKQRPVTINEKVEDKSPSIKTNSNDNNSQKNPAKELKIDLETVNIPQFVKKLSSSKYVLTEKDKMTINALVDNHKLGSYEEAAIALGVIHEAKSAGSIKPKFDEADLYPSESVVNKENQEIPKTSLENLTKERKINLAGMLETNPMLQGYEVAKSTIKALEASYNSKNFKNEIIKVVKRNTKKWTFLANRIGAKNAEISNTNRNEQEPHFDSDEIQPAIDFNANDLRSDDKILQDANKSINSGNYKKAVSTLERLPEDSPLYAAAQEKIRECSNKAVQRLRRLAAQAFQSSVPVNDLNAKSEYLKIARKHLERALDDFPQADQLSTVRENLSVINRDLLRITESLEK